MTYSPSALVNIDIVLVRPENPGNIGAVARVIRNFGFGRLCIVASRNPVDSSVYFDEEAKRFAHRSEDVLDDAIVFTTLRDALADRTWAIAASGRSGRDRAIPVPIRSAASRICWQAQNNVGAIVFGPESDGLDERDIIECDSVVVIPQRRPGPSLNLAQAVAVVCSELFQAALTPGTRAPEELAPNDSVSRMIRRMERIARHCGMTVRNRPEEYSDVLSQTIRRCHHSSYDISVVEHFLSQVEWYTGLSTSSDGG